MITLSLCDCGGNVLFESIGREEALLCFDRIYEDGDRFEIVCDTAKHLKVRVDAAIGEGEVYLPEGKMTWTVPIGEHRLAYCPGIFDQKRHIAGARVMKEDEVKAERNIAQNPLDLRDVTDFYPHCTANVETRGESCFAARNVIDGLVYNTSHGEWPFESWGIGAREDAWCLLDFGREIDMESFTLILRADFPHDAWWTEGHACFSDGTETSFSLQKTGERQTIPCRKEKIRWMRLEKMVKSFDPSAFPSLRQLEVTGKDRFSR